MTKIIKVERVCSIYEAKILKSLGVNAVSVSLVKNVRFKDHRIISLYSAKRIKKILGDQIHYVGEVDFNCNPSTLVELAKEAGFNALQPHDNSIPSPECRKYLQENNVTISYSYLEATPTYDPEYQIERSRPLNDFDINYFQIDVFSDYEDAWRFLKNESPRYPEEVQIEDINSLASHIPILISLNFTPDNMKEILQTFTNIQGVYLTLSDFPRKDGFHHINFKTAQIVLNSLQENMEQQNSGQNLEIVNCTHDEGEVGDHTEEPEPVFT